jgi:hypothetical protein
MQRIRPYKLFELLTVPPRDRLATVKIPLRYELKLIEIFCLIAAARLVNAKRFFEFGTYFGTTTLDLALTSPADAEIFTLDLRPEDVGRIAQPAPDALVTKQHFEKNGMDFDGLPEAKKIARLFGNSLEFDFSPWKDSIDFIFVDGGHSRETVASDTSNAFAIARKNAPASIFWHDYGNPDCQENTEFLDELYMQYPLFHIEDTMLCGWFSNLDLS